MTRRIFDAWAPPLFWGPPVTIAQMVSGPASFEISADTKSDAPSTFTGEVRYFDIKTEERHETFLCPGSISFIAGNAVQKVSVRFKSHSLGQVVEFTADTPLLIRFDDSGRPARQIDAEVRGQRAKFRKFVA